MTDQSSNDNSSADGGSAGASAVDAELRGPDAYGQAAMLLTESLIHGLIARSIISVADAIEIVGVAAEIKTEIAAEMGDSPANMEKSLTILRAVETSLATDLINE